MKHKFRIFIIISVVAVSSFLAVARNTPGHTPAASSQRATLPHNARASAGAIWFEQDAQITDLAITARIREGIAARKDLATNARHVSITTTGGRVVLKGVVTTSAEKRLIGNVATAVQRMENVDNQLMVKPSLSAPTGLRVIQ